MLYYSGYYYSRGAKPAGLWLETLSNLVRNWKQGKSTVLMTDDYHSFERN